MLFFYNLGVPAHFVRGRRDSGLRGQSRSGPPDCPLRGHPPSAWRRKAQAANERNGGFPAKPAVRRRGSSLPSLKMLLEHFDGIAVARYIRPQPTLFASSFAWEEIYLSRRSRGLCIGQPFTLLTAVLCGMEIIKSPHSAACAYVASRRLHERKLFKSPLTRLAHQFPAYL